MNSLLVFTSHHGKLDASLFYIIYLIIHTLRNKRSIIITIFINTFNENTPPKNFMR